MTLDVFALIISIGLTFCRDVWKISV